MPFTVLLVLLGIVISYVSELHGTFSNFVHSYKINPDFILYVCLPTLLFESAYTLDAKQFRKNLAPIMMLAVPGLLLSTVLIGTLVWSLTSISFSMALLLGAILSATDPVAVIAIFKQIGAPKRLTILVEGESLFNDAAAIVTSKLIVGLILLGTFSHQTVLHGSYEFLYEFFGGIAVGLSCGYVAGMVLGLIENDAFIEISLVTVLAYFSFMLAQNVFHVSGVMATVMAGLVLGGLAKTKISANVKSYLHNFLEYASSIANGLIFLLVGLNVNLHALYQHGMTIFIVFVIMLLSRALIIWGLIPLLGLSKKFERISHAYKIVMWWGGLRGAIALAIVLSLPKLDGSTMLENIVMGVVLATLVIKGLTIKKLVDYLGLNKAPLSEILVRLAAKIKAKKQSLAKLPQLQKGGLFSSRIAAEIKQKCQLDLVRAQTEYEQTMKASVDLNEETRVLYLLTLAMENHYYLEMFQNAHLTETAYRDLSNSVENQIEFFRCQIKYDPKSAAPEHIKSTWASIVLYLSQFPVLSALLERQRRILTIRDYEHFWGLHQGSLYIMKRLDELTVTHQQALERVRAKFTQWNQVTKQLLDSIAEQFPALVSEMQSKLAARMTIYSEYQALHEQAVRGLLPAGIAKEMEHKLRTKLNQLRHPDLTPINTSPEELLQKVPFFRECDVDEVQEIKKYLHSKTIPALQNIIVQGAQDSNMFFIARGVVRVILEQDEGENIELATLVAGEFFGEMSLLHDQPRTATVRSVTPCVLFELSRRDFDALQLRFPKIREGIERVEQQRLQ